MFCWSVVNQYKFFYLMIQIVFYDVENGLDYIYEDFYNNVDVVEYYVFCVLIWYIVVGIVLFSLCVLLFFVFFYVG